MSSPLLRPKMRLGDLLVERGYLTSEQLNNALAIQAEHGETRLLGEVLIEQEFCSEEQVLQCLSEEFRVPYIRLDNRMFDPKIFDSLPREFIEKNTVLPLFKIRDTLTVAVAEPTNVFLVDQMQSLSGCEIQLALAGAHDIRRMVQTYVPNTRVFVIDDIIEGANDDAVELIEESIDDISSEIDVAAGESPIIRLVNYIIYNAVKQRASDVHIEPTERQLRIRYRIDGTLTKVLEPPVHLAPAVASRIKIMANLDISERRLPQDGRIHVMMEGRPIDLRVSTMPMSGAEKVVIRILDNQSINLRMEDLGFGYEILEDFREQLQHPNGIILVTGPTGSGKSTTIYSALNSVSSIEKNICTVEDPIEYQFPLINQFQVNEKIGLTFPVVLRSLLRQDPDTIMVGEIRDGETARVAIQAALTGHLVFSTLHTNDACSTVTRLIDMGIESYLLAASLNMILAQRLCRTICKKCKKPYDPPKPMKIAMERMGIELETHYRGVGCPRCRNTGFSGRIAVHELLVIDDNLREIITNNPTTKQIRDYARESHMIPLRYDGLRKVKEGFTTVEEIFRVTDEGWIPKTARTDSPAQ
ncbi:MAG: hypothetical protein Tsb009_09480 [Planctomycetaceae bacterium]